MSYKYEFKRIKRTQEELNYYQKIFGDQRDEVGDLIFDLNDPNTIYKEPTVDMVCFKCGFEEPVYHHILVELNYVNKSPHSLACPKCSHTKKRGIMYPKVIVDENDNPITFQDVLDSFK